MYIHSLCVCVRECVCVFFGVCDLGLNSVAIPEYVVESIVSVNVCMCYPLTQAPSGGGNSICNDIA
jgi:hypothetical protein